MYVHCGLLARKQFSDSWTCWVVSGPQYLNLCSSVGVESDYTCFKLKPQENFEVPLYVSIHLLLLGLSNEVIFYRRNWELGEAVFLQPWWGSSLEDWDIFAASQHRSCTCSKFGWGAGKPAQLHLVFICLCVAIWPVLTETRWHLSKAKHSNLSRAMCNERQGGFVLVGKACHMFERPEKAISMETC